MEPLWWHILRHRPDPDPEHERMDAKMLETLFVMFPELLDKPDCMGLYPIHWAACNGHRWALQELLKKEVNIDAEVSSVFAGKDGHGRTPLSLVKMKLRGTPPAEIARGGKVEVKRWRERLTEAEKVLQSNGAGYGTRPPMEDLLQKLEVFKNVRVIVSSRSHGDQNDEADRDKFIWPESLPSDETSSMQKDMNGEESTHFYAKEAARVLLGSGHASTAKVERINDGDSKLFRSYEVWLLQMAKLRQEWYQEHARSDPVATRTVEIHHAKQFRPEWMRWLGYFPDCLDRADC